MFYFLVFLCGAVSAASDVHLTAGHSRDFIILDYSEPFDHQWSELLSKWENNWYSLDKKDNRLRRDSNPSSPSLDEVREYIESFQPAFKEAFLAISSLVGNSAVLTGRLKSPESVKEKLERKGYGLGNLTDVIGMRLTCQTVDEVMRIKKLISDDSIDFEVTETICNGICPDSGKYTSHGYRRVHLILLIKNAGNKSMELQIGTPYTNMWSDWNHDLVYKGPESFQDDEKVQKYSLDLAEYFLILDQERNKLPLCPATLEEANALEILEMNSGGADANKLYKKLGHPPNACFWWNDMQLASVGSKVSGSVRRGGSYILISVLSLCFYFHYN